MSPQKLSERTDIPRSVINRWLRQGANRIKADYLTRLAAALNLADPYAMFETCSSSDRDARFLFHIDLQTNPAIEQVARVHPDVFIKFTPDDWRELYSLHGTGGPLTEEGVLASARRLDAKRELRAKFEAILETEHFDTLSRLIDVLHRDTSVPTFLATHRQPGQPFKSDG